MQLLDQSQSVGPQNWLGLFLQAFPPLKPVSEHLLGIHLPRHGEDRFQPAPGFKWKHHDLHFDLADDRGSRATGPQQRKNEAGQEPLVASLLLVAFLLRYE